MAVTSKNIAQLSKKESPDNCFVGGLLHDTGKVILAQYFPKLFETVWATLQNEHVTFYEAEQKNCRLIIARSAPIWLKNGNCPRALWMQFDGIMIFSLKSRV